MKLILCIITSLFLYLATNAQSAKIMLVTGGHAYDTLQFYQIFDSIDGIEFERFTQPDANRAIEEGRGRQFDLLVFYDMWESITDKEKAAWLDLTRIGKPMLFLHHSLVSYQNWPEFEKIIGGKYIQVSPEIPVAEQSTYRHDVWIDVKIADKKHPVTSGLKDFKIFDEVYGNYRISPEVVPLLMTRHPESMPVIGWENKYNSSKIIFIQPGHDYHSFESDSYRKLISQSINYLISEK